MKELKKRFFNIKKGYKKAAKDRFKRMNIKSNHTKVSIHIRLTDYKGHLKMLFNMTHQYFFNGFLEKAMTHFVKKYNVSIIERCYIRL